MESLRVTQQRLLVMGITELELAIFCNQTRPQVKELGHQSRHKTFSLQFSLSTECSGIGGQENPHQRHRSKRLHPATDGSRCRDPQPTLGRV